MKLIGEAKYVEVEGGFYGIVADSGASFYAVNMPQQYKWDGAKVSCTVELIKDAATMAMWGVPVRILSFEIA